MLANSIRTPLAENYTLEPPQPFVGVCGVRSEDDYLMLTSLAPHILQDTEAFIVAGVKDPTVRIGRACLSPLVRPFVHSDYRPDEDYLETTSAIVEQTQDYVQGLQLNILPWMDTSYRSALSILRRHYPSLKFMLQVHRQIMERHTPEAVAEKLATLPVDYVLFDPSQSRGESYDNAIMYRFAAAARQSAPHVGTVVAGGLGNPFTMTNQYAPIARALHPVSCDAFGRLQDRSGQHLDRLRTGRYLHDWRAATVVCQRSPKPIV